ncbi:MAG: molecular chaperone HtpG [Amoebophilaceae bacterium]|nr:molecular chaperone HtpG [Amoebophilaceae bacterium]
MNEKGTISVHTENIFPIIKKFLYSDQDIFLRELVANGVDAIQKLKKFSAMGLYEGAVEQLSVEVLVNQAQKTLTIKDHGVGMTADEIKQYINQIAFSGATEFVEKYKDQVEKHQLIGCFGLGFYSAFMVAKKVEIITKSYQSDAPAAHWSCDGSTSFELSATEKEEVGTEVILHLAEEEFLIPERIQSILTKHCRFLPIDIIFDGKVINNTAPLWIKNPLDLQPEDYLSFYKELYPFAADPLFWIHLNIDYPFNLTGILYFPKAANYFEQKETIQLYARQVFITNEVQEVIPDFLRLLHGVIDSPDIPLNVSRSALQSDSNVKKINGYVAKKVAEKLENIFQEDRKNYESAWEDIAIFIKYGMITHDKFYEKVKDVVLLQNTAGAFYTIEEYKTKVSDKQTDKHGNLVLLYTTDPKKNKIYLQSAEQKGYDVLLLNSQIDTNFINFSEQKFDKVKFKGIDTDTMERLIEQEVCLEQMLTEAEQQTLKEIYEIAIESKPITWNVVAMSPDELPVILITSEMFRRMEQFTKRKEKEDWFPMTFSINGNHPLAKKILNAQEKSIQKTLARRAYHLALLAKGNLEGEQLADFIQGYTEEVLTN